MTDRAERDLITNFEYIAADAPNHAQQWGDGILEAINWSSEEDLAGSGCLRYGYDRARIKSIAAH